MGPFAGQSDGGLFSRSVVSDPQRPRGLQPTRLLCPWGFPSKRVLEWGAIAFSGTNPMGYQIVRTHTKETTVIQDPASPNHQ